MESLDNFANTMMPNFKKRHLIKSLQVIFFLLITLPLSAQTIRYIKPAASGNGDGSSWANASDDLQAMITASVSGTDQVWVALGEYILPVQIDMKNGVNVYGGFTGNETTLTERPIFTFANIADPNIHTILNANATATTPRRVLNQAASFTIPTIWDGFVITGGQLTTGNGGGASLMANTTLSNCAVINNTAFGSGGGIYSSGNVILENLTVSNNKAGYNPSTSVYTGTTTNGGGLYINGAQLTLKGNMIFENDSTNSNGGAIYKAGTGDLVTADLNSIIIKDNAAITGSGGGIYLSATGTTSNLFNATVTGNSSKTTGGGIFANTAINFTGSITNNKSGSNGGGIYANAATIISNSTILYNLAKGSGGGIYAMNALTLENDTTSYNKAGYDAFSIPSQWVTNGVNINGGGVYMNNSTMSFTLKGKLVFENDSAYSSGGAIFKDGTGAFVTTELDSIIIKNNTSLMNNGGGIQINNASGINSLNNAIIFNNSSGSNGGGIYAGIAITISNSTFHNNLAKVSGGGIYAANALTISGSTILNNLAKGSGGGIYAAHALTLENDTTSYNKAGYDAFSIPSQWITTGSNINGGGVCMSNNTQSLTLIGINVFENDSAFTNGGGIYFSASGISSLANTIVKNNYAKAFGGGIYANTASAITGSTINYNNSSSGGGGIYLNANSIISESIIRYNLTKGSGGGIGSSATAFTLTMENDSTSDNKAGYDVTISPTQWITSGSANGGGIALNGNQHLELKGKLFFENDSAYTSGGAIYKTGSGNFIATELDSAIIKNNSAIKATGGGIYYSASNTSVLSNAIITGNIAGTYGGGIYTASVASIANTILSNNAGVQGGGIYTSGISTITNTSINDNYAGTYGGGIYANNKIILDTLSIYTNTAETQGGGIYKTATGTMDIRKSTLANNSSAKGGGIFTATNAVSTLNRISNTTFSSNTSTNGEGGGIYASGANADQACIEIAFSTFNNNTASNNSGNAIYYIQATGRSLYGNILYGNGTGTNTEIRTPATTALPVASYNILREMNLDGTGNKNLAAGMGGEIFTSTNGDIAHLENNGGNTQSLAIKKGGIAHNFIPIKQFETWANLNKINTDQRDSIRPYDCAVDAGAIELQSEKNPPLKITVRTSSTSVCLGTAPVLNADVEGGNGTYTYQWATRTNDTKWIESGNKSTYKPFTNPVSDSYYRCIVTSDACDAVDSTHVAIIENCIEVNDDEELSLVGSGPLNIDILANDSLSACTTPILSIVVQPLNGNAVLENQRIIYTPNNGFIGNDSLSYSVTCGNNEYIAMVRITIDDYPDNIITADCYGDPPSGKWTIKNSYRSSELIFSMNVPLVGDLDGDGKTDILAPGAVYVGSSFASDTLKIFDAVEKKLKIKFRVEKFHAGFGTVATADVDGNSIAEIFVATNEDASAGNQGYLFCYLPDGSLKWKSDKPYTTNAPSYAFPYLSIADINNDGIPEILANDRIFNAQTGALLLDCDLIATGKDYGTGAGHISFYGTQRNSKGAFSTLADMDGDGTLEMVAGRNIYKLDINSTNPAANFCTILRSAEVRKDIGDGYTVVADINMDGHLDVIVARDIDSKTGCIYVWDGLTGKLINKNPIYVPSNNVSGGIMSIPFVGDLNKDGYPEIAFSCYKLLSSYKYNSSTNDLELFWTLLTTDTSSATTLTLFDFNQDGKMELVYRDETDLRIIDGSTKKDLAKINCQSFTMNEYPVVADVSGGKQASIIVLGQISKTWSSGVTADCNGYVYIFDSDPATGGDSWAPARKVWNQWTYNAVNVNDNLTIPQYQLNPATKFPGEDKTLGTADDVHPYNGFLMQQTTLSQDGIPFYLLPDLQWANPTPSFLYDGIADSLSITINAVNNGDAGIGKPVYFTIYKDIIQPANVIKKVDYPGQINAGQNLTFSFSIDKLLKKYGPINKILINLNDSAGKYPYYKECQPNDPYAINFSKMVIAQNDFVVTPVDSLITFFPISNDISGDCSLNINLEVITDKHPTHGYITVNADKSITYKPFNGFLGLDSLEYGIKCNQDSSKARVYIYVFPNSIKICQGTGGTYNTSFTDPYSGTTVKWFDTRLNTPFNTIILNGTENGKKEYPGLRADVTFPAYLGGPLVSNPGQYVVNIVPLLMYWNNSALNNNWNDPLNWTDESGNSLNAVPLACTTVHIPGNAQNFPSLDSMNTIRTATYGKPECDSIIFHFGSEVARPHYLKYSKAFVQYNFGYYDNGNIFKSDRDYLSAKPMNRGQWYALATPLNNIVSGDFSLGGYPNFWQKGFKTAPEHNSTLSGEWYDPENTNALKIGKKQNFSIAVWAGKYESGSLGEDSEYQKNLNNLNGILEMPYFENKAVSDQHRIHTYENGKSTFFYYYYQIPQMPVEPTKSSSIERAGEAYRFVFENQMSDEIIDSKKTPVFKIRVAAGKEIMIGNPFISSLEFNKFYELNNPDQDHQKFDPFYRLYVNGTWETYSYTAGAPVMDYYIAPLQAFFINTTPGNDSIDLYFPPEMVSVTRESGSAMQLRAGNEHNYNAKENAFYINAKNEEGNSWMTLVVKNDGEERKNVRRMFNLDPLFANVPQVYASDDKQTKNTVQYAVSDGTKQQITLGIRSGKQAETELSFLNQKEMPVESLFLLDTYLATLTNLLEQNSYKFTHIPEKADGRFVLLLNSRYIPTGTEINQYSGFNVYAENRTLHVETSDIIESVIVSDIRGMKLLQEEKINNRYFYKKLNVPAGVYIVSVRLENGELKTNKIILK